MIELRQYQKEIAHNGFNTLTQFEMVYLAMEVRTGKTLTALEICNRYDNLFRPNHIRVLFSTRKKAMASVQEDFEKLGCAFDLTVINHESVHKTESKFDIVIIDEAHRLGAYATPSLSAKRHKEIITKSKARVIYLSGTPSPESYSQLYHQFWVHPRSPFIGYGSFYKWAKVYVNVTQKYVAHGNAVNDYSDAKYDQIMDRCDHLFQRYTQKEAGFEQTVDEEVLMVDMKPVTLAMVKRLMDDEVIEGAEHTILADTGVKMQNKCHQLWSGTIKFECGERMVIDDSKAQFIRERFFGDKIAIFYKFIAEGEMLKNVFPNWTTSPEEFNESDDMVFISQIQSGREGVNLSTADYLIMLNIDFSAVSYLQGRDRMSSMSRTKTNKVFWIFARGGIEQRIYRTVRKKEDYTLRHFEKDFLY